MAAVPAIIPAVLTRAAFRAWRLGWPMWARASPRMVVAVRAAAMAGLVLGPRGVVAIAVMIPRGARAAELRSQIRVAGLGGGNSSISVTVSRGHSFAPSLPQLCHRAMAWSSGMGFLTSISSSAAW